MEIVPKYLKFTDHVLDIGTGGGEKLIEFSRYFTKGVGIDPYAQMIKVAKENAFHSANTKVTFEKKGADDLGFAENTFDVVINRHAVVVPSEIVRVLKTSGYFITQQVATNNMQNFKDEFNYHPTYQWPNDNKTLVEEFAKRGCRVITTGEYNVRYWVKDVESLVFWLKAVNLPENFTIDRHGNQLNQILAKYTTPRGVLTNEHRSLLIICKD
jgi:SAM-dependent methyltransferase